MSSNCNQFTAVTTRRELLRLSAGGFGWLALADLLARAARCDAMAASGNRPASDVSASAAAPLAPRVTLHNPRAKRVIFLFMHGGPSQVDTFDYKPLLERDHGKPLPFDKPRIVSSETGNLLRSPWKFQQHGQSGAWVSDLFPFIAGCVDDICFIRSMHGSNSRHGGALLELHTGSDTFVRPSLGSWITYGLGTENEDLPGFITISSDPDSWWREQLEFRVLAGDFQGTPLGSAGVPAEQAKIPFIENVDRSTDLERMELDLIQQMNRERLAQSGPDSALEGRINSFELAFRMQTAAPSLQDIRDESEETLKLYGLDDPKTRNFGRQCLMARRFAERGVRFVQVTHSYKWDQHDNLARDHASNALEVDKPIAGLLKDLKRRGLLEDTLVLWGGEFGRTPVAQGTNGRDHNPHGFTMWLAGGGVKPGLQFGATDDYGYYATQDKVHFHDLHATILHLLGLDHTKLTYRYAGRDFRLTDVHGEFVRGLLN